MDADISVKDENAVPLIKWVKKKMNCKKVPEKEKSAPDKALLVKLFNMNEESATIALRKFRVQKNVKSGKGPLTPAGLLKLVKRFEETGKLED
ncbi:hypothetical protein TNCV_4940211 [Trichonephila clavipes]|nr:hypothetical protein TNCV_4940211 [Trichonephila clavipes]